MAEQHDSPLVLIVDDHLAAAQMLARLFTNNEYRVHSVDNGESALDYARHFVPDLILLDIMMPVMDGYEVFARLREHPATKNIPTIFITAKDQPEDVEHGLQLGADDYMPKPVKPRELLARAKSKIESNKLRRALRQRTTDLEALLRVSEELNNHIQVDELLNLIVYLIVDLISCEVSGILRLNEHEEVIDSCINNNDGSVHNGALDLPRLIEYGQDTETVCWHDVHESPVAAMPAGMAFGLAHGGQLHGVIFAASDEPYDAHALRLFGSIGRQATLALRNAELYEIKVSYAEHLEEMVEERTAELRSAQQLLVRAEKLASVGRLAAGIAHEINNPLMPIMVNLELMLEDIQEKRSIAAEDIDESLKSAKRIKRIVERLLQFTRKQGEDRPAMEPLDITSVLEDVVALSHTYVRRSGVNIDFNIEEQATIYGNRDQLEQVFLNLILNAQAAIVDGGDLIISSRIKNSDLIITFEDNGTGIEPKIIDKIFEPFVSTKESGTGLGLFISYGIIQNHNGTIEVESEVGKGTTFILTLPIIQGHSN